MLYRIDRIACVNIITDYYVTIRVCMVVHAVVFYIVIHYVRVERLSLVLQRMPLGSC